MYINNIIFVSVVSVITASVFLLSLYSTSGFSKKLNALALQKDKAYLESVDAYVGTHYHTKFVLLPSSITKLVYLIKVGKEAEHAKGLFGLYKRYQQSSLFKSFMCELEEYKTEAKISDKDYIYNKLYTK